jgi:hypothetical protein
VSDVTVDAELLVLAFVHTLRHPVPRALAVKAARAMIDHRDALGADQRALVMVDIHNAVNNSGGRRAAEEVALVTRVAEAMAG